MSSQPLEDALRRLPQIGRLIDGDESRQIWRFDLDGKPLRIHFYPRRSAIVRAAVGNPALRELANFQRLQKAAVPAPRAISALVGFRLNDEIGDALLLESIDGDAALEDFPRIDLRRQLIEILHRLARGGLGHKRLSLDSFRLRDGKLFLTDARGLTRNGLQARHLFRLAHSALPVATRSDYLRVWRALVPDRPLPKINPISNKTWRRFIRQAVSDSKHFATIEIDQWSGVLTRRTPCRARWASASRQDFFAEHWREIWPDLLKRIEADQLTVIKRDDSGEVLATDIMPGGQRFPIIVKRPRRKNWWRRLSDVGRGSRARRTWIKTWKMLIRNVPCEWPLLLMERRRFGYAVESIVIFQCVSGATLAKVDLDSIEAKARENLFRRTGRILRRIEDLGFTHADAKSTNWMVFDDPKRGPTPILVDVDGVRHYRWSMMGIDRLLRAMKQHTQYVPADSMHLCLGFAPRAKLARDAIDHAIDKTTRRQDDKTN